MSSMLVYLNIHHDAKITYYFSACFLQAETIFSLEGKIPHPPHFPFSLLNSSLWRIGRARPAKQLLMWTLTG
jgi:hypothetical protein